MNFKYFALPVIALAVLLAGCGEGSQAACPPLGNVTAIDKPEQRFTVDTIVNSSIPVFSWDCIDTTSLEATSKSELTQYIGKPLVLLFHKSMNCPGCKEQLPYIKGAYENLKDTGLTVLAIYRSDQPKDVKAYSQSNAIGFTSLADPGDKIASKLGFAVGAPMTVFIDKKGIIKKYKFGPLGSQAEVEEIIKSL